MAVTTNLVAAIESILSQPVPSEPYYWVDALCINQADVSERNMQVRIMGSIYKKAKMVLAWLGPEQDKSTEVIEIIKQLHETIISNADAMGNIEALSKPAPRELLETLKLSTSNCSLASLATSRQRELAPLLQGRQFWKRAWILQEMLLAEDVVLLCGPTALNFHQIYTVFSWLMSVLSSSSPTAVDWQEWLGFRTAYNMSLVGFFTFGYERIHPERPTSDSEGVHLQAWKTLQRAKHLFATDPLDKVYSLLGLINIGLEVDYTKAAEDVYRDVAVALFDQVPRSEWFYLTGVYLSNRMSSLPTWIVDWDALTKTKSREPYMQLDLQLYNASLGMPDLSQRTKFDRQILSISGILCDEIGLLGPLPVGDNIESVKAGFQFDLTLGLPGAEILRTLIPPGIPRGQGSLRLCLRDTALNDGGHRFAFDYTFLSLGLAFLGLLGDFDAAGPTIEDRFQFVDDLFGGPGAAECNLDSVGSEDDWARLRFKNDQLLRSRILPSYWSGRHFYTRKGFLGHAPEGIREGDLVCVLESCGVPVILRKVDRFYHFVSTCFVLGLLDGEAAVMLRRGRASLQDFNIH